MTKFEIGQTVEFTARDRVHRGVVVVEADRDEYSLGLVGVDVDDNRWGVHPDVLQLVESE